VDEVKRTISELSFSGKPFLLTNAFRGKLPLQFTKLKDCFEQKRIGASAMLLITNETYEFFWN
jgi:hypothetical protein